MNNLQTSLQIKMYFFIVEIKIVNPDDQNIKPLQKKLPGIYTTEKLSNDNIMINSTTLLYIYLVFLNTCILSCTCIYRYVV